jgi:hypothetical protein
MGFFRRKSKKDKEAKAFDDKLNKASTPATPVAGKPPKIPTTPPTHPIKEKRDVSSDEIKQQPKEGTPEWLEALNLLPTTEDADGMEMVLGALPEPTYVPYNPDNLPPRGEEEEYDDEVEKERADKTDGTTAEEDKDVVHKPEDETAHVDKNVTKNVTKNVPDSPLDAKETDPVFEDDDNIPVQCDGPEDVSRKLLQVFQCAGVAEQIGVLLPPSVRRLVPPSCQPVVEATPKRGMERNSSYYNEQFAIKFLDVSRVCCTVYGAFGSLYPMDGFIHSHSSVCFLGNIKCRIRPGLSSTHQ